ncbi:hypothetical protein GUJ93_ZPchr0006g41433 [Zizania palustris]|uniref:Uncharacterized protein n=1 Tax=Zizania palustris TaxID=103762 RepID=A0A8J5SW49_ZIZPA|nr:hypothetical protein GUJ93_ZPchr0006g41433 [Zizania palustris]
MRGGVCGECVGALRRAGEPFYARGGMGGDVRLDGDDTGARSGVGEGGWTRRDIARASTGEVALGAGDGPAVRAVFDVRRHGGGVPTRTAYRSEWTQAQDQRAGMRAATWLTWAVYDATATRRGLTGEVARERSEGAGAAWSGSARGRA